MSEEPKKFANHFRSWGSENFRPEILGVIGGIGMSRKADRPLVEQVWIVVHENEGLILEVHTNQRAAIAAARRFEKRNSGMRTEVAKFLIAINSLRSFGSPKDGIDDR
ncbi:MAG: hypothetical protein ACKN81_00445 [Pirellulaceae bacterium]